jgi:hypothetical protein
MRVIFIFGNEACAKGIDASGRRDAAASDFKSVRRL